MQFDINIIEIELSSLCNAKCSGCMRTILDNRGKYYYKGNLLLDDIIDWFEPLDISNTKIKMCGVLGDPMINPELYEIIFYFLYEKNVRDLEMSTNGGTRPAQFWKDLGLLSKQSNKRFYIHWAVDGVTRNDYRENVILDRVWDNIRAYHSTGGHSIWQYIIFDYNEDEVEMARQKAKDNGMKFATRVSWRNTSEKVKVTSKAANKIDSDSYEVVEARARTKQYKEALEKRAKRQIDDTIIICKSNKRAYLYNQQIRHKILWKEERISNGDYLMVVRNNYTWLDEDSKAGFIANGDTVKVKHIRKYEELYGFNFAHITIELVDYPEEPEIDVIVMLDTLESEQAALDYEKYKELYNLISQDYNSMKNAYKRNKAIKEDKYLNALQIKYAYAITCHKSQGGQWNSVFVEQSYFTDDMLNKEYLRWLYTSLTRASEKLYLINFSDKFFN